MPQLLKRFLQEQKVVQLHHARTDVAVVVARRDQEAVALHNQRRLLVRSVQAEALADVDEFVERMGMRADARLALIEHDNARRQRVGMILKPEHIIRHPPASPHQI